MPTYEYQCPQCGHKFEEFQSIKAAPLKKCPNCGGNKVQRMIGCGAGLIFKGSGFYCTDYRSDGYQKAAKKDNGSTPAKPSDKKESSAAETKPATPAPAAEGASKPSDKKAS